MSGTEGRVYGGDCNLIHIPDGQRAAAGGAVADIFDAMMRFSAEGRTDDERLTQALCPGCYMVAIFNMALRLARVNGQSIRELGATMSSAFNELMICGDDAACIEEIVVKLEQEEERNAKPS